ncbi:hypothetical protein J6590_027245 [Homalodisca vitripennis]|nr:hypothetical protein J6590_027245 [Homalodisca vitripennis]
MCGAVGWGGTYGPGTGRHAGLFVCAPYKAAGRRPGIALRISAYSYLEKSESDLSSPSREACRKQTRAEMEDSRTMSESIF